MSIKGQQMMVSPVLLNTGRQRSLPFHEWLSVGYIDKVNSLSPYAKFFLQENEEDSAICRYCGTCMKASLRLWVGSFTSLRFRCLNRIAFTLKCGMANMNNNYLFRSLPSTESEFFNCSSTIKQFRGQ